MNGTGPTYGPHLHAVLDAAAPATVLSDEHRSTTVGDFAAETRAWAGSLTDGGLVRDDRVVLLLPNGLALGAAVIGAMRAGLIPVPLHPGSSRAQVEAVLGDCRPALVVTGAGAPPAGFAGRTGLRVGRVDPAAPFRHPGPAAEGEPGGTALIMYTSGSTSVPRGVVCPHPQAAFAVEAIAARLAYRPEDLVFSSLPMSFDYGLYQLFLALRSGSRLFLARSDLGPGLLSRAFRAGATVMPVVPSLARRLCLLATRAPDGRPPVRLFTNTGDVLTPADCARLRSLFPAAKVVRMFGLTECKRVTIGDPDDDLVAPDAVGAPLPGTRIEVRDAHGELCRPGEVGELVVRGPHVMAGYWGDPEESRRRFRTTPEGPALFSGDFGRIDEQGRFCFSHRADDVYKVGAVRVSAQEIESAAMRVEGVTGAGVVRRPDRATPVLFLASDRSKAELARALRQELGAHRTPENVVVLPELPTTGNGKTDRGRLRALAARPTTDRAGTAHREARRTDHG